MTIKHSLYAGILWSLTVMTPSSLAQTPTVPSTTPSPGAGFSSSSTLNAQSLSDEFRNLLASLVTIPDKDQKIERARKQLCPSVVRPPAIEATGSKAALALTESDMSVEVAFERNGPDTSAPGTPFSLFIDFREHDVLVRSSKPRFPSEAGGNLLMPDKTSGRALWMEGKGGTDTLVFVPPLAECGIRAVALCPRSYVPRTGLQRNGYALTGARYYYSTKADGLFATDKQNPGRVRAGTFASEGISVPEKWFDEQLSGVTPSATFKHILSRPKGDPGPFSPIILPRTESVEARLELGRGDVLLRTISKRTSIEISQFELPEKQKVVVHFTDTLVEAGSCFLVAKWSETQL